MSRVRSHHVLRVRRAFCPQRDVAESSLDTVFVEKFVKVIHFFSLSADRANVVATIEKEKICIFKDHTNRIGKGIK